MTEASGLVIEYRAVESLIPFAKNARMHSDAQIAQIAASVKEWGWTNPVLIDGGNGIIAGHGRVLAARKLGIEQVPCIQLEGMSEAQKRAYIIADNKLALNAGWDEELLALELGDLQAEGFDIDLIGFSQEELDDLLNSVGAEGFGDGVSLSDRFLIPPFSVLNAREGWWQDRKRGWIDMGLRSEVGRDETLTFSVSSQPPATYRAKNEYEAKVGREVTWAEFVEARPDAIVQKGTSIFDPTLCEVAYRWFCPPSGLVLDPFAGGSVRGIVAAKLGREYIGVDLRDEQVEANRVQAASLCQEIQPVWITGDSRNIDKLCKGTQADFVFSCPPYADLEVYSDDPADLSTLDYPEFRDAYLQIIHKTCSLLKPDRFACFVVGEVRDKRGAYYDFIGDTVQAFRDAGLDYYNEAILVTVAGSLPIRAGKQFSASRKLGKTHQNILVFCKGDPKKAVEACGDVEIDEELFAEAGDEG